MVVGWSRRWWLLFVVSACGGRAVSHEGAGPFASGGAPATATAGGSGTGVAPAGSGNEGGGGAGASGAGGTNAVAGSGGVGAACSAPMYSQDLPATDGCFTGNAQGWIEVPCVCDLWLANTTQAALDVTVTLSQSASQPASTDAAAELDIADPNSVFFAKWSSQVDAGLPMTVSHAGDTTSVEFEGASVALGPVTVGACSLIKGTARVRGTAEMLDMRADFRDAGGSVVLTSDGECFNPPPLR